MTYKCPSIGVEVYVGEGPEKGHETFIGYVSPLNKMTVSGSITYKGAKGVQEPDHKEGSTTIDNLEKSVAGPMGKFEKEDWDFGTELINEEELVILA